MPCKHSLVCRESRRAFLHQGGRGLLTLAALGFAGDGVLPVSAIAGVESGKEKTYPIPSADGVNIDRGSSVMIVRYANHVYAFSMACPHENAAVKWVAKQQRFFCTKHDSEYTPDGTYTTGHATRNLDRFPVRRDGTSVVVSLDRVFHSDANKAAWAYAAVDV
jgi:nitrite reductase/ring-hydroxylating ferredoxin subunit